MIQVIRKGAGGTIWTEFLGRRATSCIVNVYTGAGTRVVTAGVGVPDAVNTTISAAAAAGDDEIAVVSATGIQGGRRYLLDGEEVGVKFTDGVTLFLWAPLERAHASGVAFQGVRVSYAVGASAAADSWADGYATFVADNGVEQVEALHCTPHAFPEVMISGVDTRQVFPAQDQALSSRLDLDLAYRAARDNFLIDLGGKKLVHHILGVAQFRRLASMRFWLDRRGEFGQAWAEEMKVIEDEYTALLDKVPSVSPVDGNEDGATTVGPEKHGLGGLDLESL